MRAFRAEFRAYLPDSINLFRRKKQRTLNTNNAHYFSQILTALPVMIVCEKIFCQENVDAKGSHRWTSAV